MLEMCLASEPCLSEGAALSGNVALCDCRFRTIAVIRSGSAKYILHYFAAIVNDLGLNLI